MKKLLFISALAIGLSASAQKFFTKNGHTSFKASVEAFEAVEAENKSTTVVLNTKTGDIASLLFVKAFHFEIALMEEHFNENYMDSDKHPKATFKGKIKDFDAKELGEDQKEYELDGTLTIRNKEKAVSTKIRISKKDGQILVEVKFSVIPSEFDIEIPKIVESKIAERILISGKYGLKEKK